ncbi:MAG: carboxypeptidase-like regulatory domain-containing protein, partial [Acidobacteria bacterium]|nr:carboxypeptidase-like regulatory domain-containing protein [Acidobacteriota bacterium]
MRTKKLSQAGIVEFGIAAFLAVSLAGMSACQLTDQTVPIDNDDLGGVVTSGTGPEAGVWVIAETTDLPTKFVKIVVTDDQGRYVMPDLPTANYDVWVRGYGLVDSPKVQTGPGEILNLSAVTAPNPRAAAEYYPAGDWFSLREVPEEDEFPGTGPQGNGISPNMESQAEWIRSLKSGGCMACHQLGNKA